MSRLLSLGLALGALAAAGACKRAPTTVLLHVEAASGLPYPDELRLSAFSEQGAGVSGQKLAGATLPNDVVLYPREQSGVLRLLVRAGSKGVAVGEGTTTVALRAEEQVRATAVVQPGPLPDQDSDGVPDVIDNCPAQPNPTQGPCPTPDAGRDLGPDAQPDLPGGDWPPLDRGPARERRPDALVCTCPLGCVPSSPTCRKVVAANGYTATSFASIGPISADVVIDTKACELKVNTTVAGKVVGGGPTALSACVIALDSLSIQPGVIVRAQGENGLVLLVKQDVTIHGTLDVGAKGDVPGPRGAKGGVAPAGGPGVSGQGSGGGKVCTCSGLGQDDCGGGGGGHGEAGAPGGNEGTACAAGSPGGQSYGGASLVPLTVGSGGASPGQATAAMLAAGGGAGGGALQISCSGTMTIQGAISAGGGGGEAISLADCSSGGGGGGAGGGVLLEAASFAGKGIVAANGGGGGGGGGVGSSGVCTGFGTDGEDGGPVLYAAKGGTAGSGGCVKGGDGGTGSSPQAGASAPQNAAAGGGGGAGGRIRFNWYSHNATVPIASSAAVVSTGEVAVQ